MYNKSGEYSQICQVTGHGLARISRADEMHTFAKGEKALRRVLPRLEGTTLTPASSYL